MTARVDAAQARVAQAVRQQGEAVTDKVADAVKERLFGAPAAPASPRGSEPIAVDDATIRPVR